MCSGSTFKQVYGTFSDQHKKKDYHGIVAAIPDIPVQVSPRYAIFYKALVMGSLSAFMRTDARCPQRLSHLRACFSFCTSLLTEVAEMHECIVQLDTIFGAQHDNTLGFASAAPMLLDFIKSTVVRSIATTESAVEHFPKIGRAVVVSLKIEMCTGLADLKYTGKMLEVACRAKTGLTVHFESMQLAIRVSQCAADPAQLVDQLIKVYNGESLNPVELVTLIVIGHTMSLVKPTITGFTNQSDALTVYTNLVKLFKRHHHQEPSDLVLNACLFCRTNMFKHIRINLAIIAFKYIGGLFNTHDVDMPDNLLDVIEDELSIVPNLQCSAQSTYKQAAQEHLNTILCTKHREPTSKAIAKFLENMCRKQLNRIFIHRADIFKFLSYHVTHEGKHSTPVILAHYLRVISMMTSKEYNGDVNQLKSPIWLLCKEQRRLDELYPIDTIMEEMQWVFMGTLPIERVCLVHVMMLILENATLTSGLLSDAHRLQLIERILCLASSDNERFQSVRVVNALLFMTPAPEMNDRIRRIVCDMKDRQPPDRFRWHIIEANLDYLEYLHGHLATIEANRSESIDVRQVDGMKIFSTQNLEKECAVVDLLVAALCAYSKFVDGTDEYGCRNTYAWETKCALHGLMKIGQYLSIRHYREKAIGAYRQLLVLARRASDDSMQIEAIMHIAANAQLFEDLEGTDKLKTIMVDGQAFLANTIGQFETWSHRAKRQAVHCVMLLGLYNIAYGQRADGKDQLRFAECLLAQLEAGSNDSEQMLRLRHSIVLLMAATKYRMPCPHPVIKFAEYVTMSFSSVRSVGHDEAMMMLTMMFEALWEITHYSLARYDLGELEAAMALMLKLAGRWGCTYAAAQVLMSWAQLDLLMENGLKCQRKLDVLDDILNANPKSWNPPYGAIIKYLRNHTRGCACFTCDRPFVQRLIFEQSTIYSRMLYINGDFMLSESGFRHTLEYWRDNPHIFDPSDQKLPRCEADYIRRTEYRMFWHYGQCLRRNDKSKQCLEMYQKALTCALQLQDNAIVHEIKFHVNSIEEALCGPADQLTVEAGMRNRLRTADSEGYIPLIKQTPSSSSSGVRALPKSKVVKSKRLKKVAFEMPGLITSRTDPAESPAIGETVPVAPPSQPSSESSTSLQSTESSDSKDDKENIGSKPYNIPMRKLSSTADKSPVVSSSASTSSLQSVAALAETAPEKPLSKKLTSGKLVTVSKTRTRNRTRPTAVPSPNSPVRPTRSTRARAQRP